MQRNLDSDSRRSSLPVDGRELSVEYRRSLAHNLGNLLQVINGNLELLSTRIEDDKLRGYIANAQTAARQLTDLAHGLVENEPGGRA